MLKPNQRLSCFRPTITTSSPSPSGNPTLTTTLYHTEFGLFSLTWCRNLFGRSFHLHLLFHNSAQLSFSPHTSTPSFQLQIKPFTIWKKRGSKKIIVHDNTAKFAHIFWDLSRAKFGSRPEPLLSSFYITVVIDGVVALLVGDESNCATANHSLPAHEQDQVMVLKREHVYGHKSLLPYTTKATFGGKERDISINCRLEDGDDPKLYFSVDNQRVLQIKHLKWKFRGTERIEVDGIPVQVSWDVHRWLFEDHHDSRDDDRYALFMFRFEKLGLEDELSDDYSNERNGIWPWSQSQFQQTFGFPVGLETKRMKKSLLRSGRSSSSSSLSSASSSCSSVMEWASAEENELKGPAGFSLAVYAWKS